jgi:hypothetical protein
MGKSNNVLAERWAKPVVEAPCSNLMQDSQKSALRFHSPVPQAQGQAGRK